MEEAADLAEIGEVARYKGIVDRWNTWDKIAAQCRRMSVWAAEALLDGEERP
jgi:hypothetical protein